MLRINYDDLKANDEWGSSYNWEGKPFTGIVYECYRNGQLANVFEMEDGEENGAVCEWYPSGRLKLEGYGYFNGFAWSREWHENGNLKRETLSRRGQRIREKIYHEDGQLLSEFVLPPQEL